MTIVKITVKLNVFNKEKQKLILTIKLLSALEKKLSYLKQ